ncbi:MAG: hypothetical protein ACRC6B_06590 [Fusobacteriaceae bacterium]
MNLKRVSGIKRAENFLGSSVISQNPNAILELWNLGKEGRCFGVKDSSEIPVEIIDKLIENSYLWNTLDSSSDRGRALDLKLLNPITGKPMIGSSSGTAINVLYGINDVGIGTDGGGSVLAPAIGVNLYSCLCSGIGLKGINEKKSTDNLNFVPGIGFMAGEFRELIRAVKNFTEDEEKEDGVQMKIAIEKGVEIYLTQDFKRKNRVCQLPEFPGGSSRDKMIEYLKGIFQEHEIIIYLETNIELEGTGDTVLGCMGVKAGEIQKKSGKRFIKVLNMIDASALTIPTGEIGSAIVIAGRKGKKAFQKILEIGEELNREYRPELYKKYFLNYPLAKIDTRGFRSKR